MSCYQDQRNTARPSLYTIRYSTLPGINPVNHAVVCKEAQIHPAALGGPNGTSQCGFRRARYARVRERAKPFLESSYLTKWCCVVRRASPFTWRTIDTAYSTRLQPLKHCCWDGKSV